MNHKRARRLLESIRWMIRRRRALPRFALVAPFAVCSILSACGDDDAPRTKSEIHASTPHPAVKDPVEYPRDRLLQVTISLPEGSWNVLRYQGLDVTTQGCDLAKEYDWFDASLTFDGQAERGSIRKKGYMGSLSAVRPSLKLKFEREGIPGTTLNNNRQDPSNTRQCTTYALFEKAGLPAPRCSLAQVYVNERDVRIYTHVEAIKKPFLARVFGDDSGNLYQGEHADFTSEGQKRFTPETNEDTGDTSDLSRLTAALSADDAQLEAELGKVLALDEFLTYWAMEVITGTVDGYSGSIDNFYVYHNPKDGLFHFIVYGADASFSENEAPKPSTAQVAVSVLIAGALPARLYSHPVLKQRYEERLRKLVNELWIESDVVQEIRHWSTLAQSPESAVEPLVSFVGSHRAKLLDELDEGISALPDPSSRPCRLPGRAPTTGSIEVNWANSASERGTAAVTHDLALPFEGGQLSLMNGKIKGWAQLDDEDPNVVLMRVIGPQQSTGRILAMGFEMPKSEFTDGTHLFHGVESVGGVAELFPPDLAQGPLLVVIGSGSFILEGTASQSTGGVVRLTWNAQSVPW